MTKKELEKKITEIANTVNDIEELADDLKAHAKRITSLIDDIPDPLEIDDEDLEDGDKE